MTSRFENWSEGTNADGYKEHGNEVRPNIDALEAKRDEYLMEDVNEVLKGYDQSKIDVIAKSIDEIESDNQANQLLMELVEDVEFHILKKHNVALGELSPSGELDRHDKRIVDAMSELEDTYPKEDIIANIKVLIKQGYL